MEIDDSDILENPEKVQKKGIVQTAKDTGKKVIQTIQEKVQNAKAQAAGKRYLKRRLKNIGKTEEEMQKQFDDLGI